MPSSANLPPNPDHAASRCTRSACGSLAVEGCVFTVDDFPRVTMPELAECDAGECTAVVVVTPTRGFRRVGICRQTATASSGPEVNLNDAAHYLQKLRANFE
jgi:hypothetical protein